MPKKHELRRRERKESLAGKRIPRGGTRPSRETGGKAEARQIPAGRCAGRGVVLAICGLLLLGTALVFVQTARYEFVNCDDNEYVYENTAIQRGPTWQCAWWAITSPHSANWHPLTWLSHALDWRLFGKWNADLDRYVQSWPGGHHLVNLGIHAICVILLYLVLQAMTGATWPSAFVAAVFAIHPLHVESVAWATGRKDTLSALLFLLTLAAYHAYATRVFSWWRYAVVVVTFGLGLTAKPMLVTVPFVLLLLDYWPLRRIAFFDARNRALSALLPARVILEKIPLLALSVGSCFLTTWAQASVGAFKPLDFPFRLANAVISYAAFLGQMFWPAGMVVQYVHKGPSLRLEDTLLPLAVLVPITLASIWFGLRKRYLLVGWLWYVGMLVPVIGLVQVGAQARADRYTYLTQIGLYMMIAWGLRDVAATWRWRALVYAAASAAVLAALAAVAWRQTSFWQNSLTLWTHSVECQPLNDFAQSSYADALYEAGRADEANVHHRESYRLNPKYIAPRCHLAGNLYKEGKQGEGRLNGEGKPQEAAQYAKAKFDEALAVCDEALAEAALCRANGEPIGSKDDAQIHFLRAIVLHALNRVDEAIAEFRASLAENGDNPDALADLAFVFWQAKRYGEAHDLCAKALQIKPEFPEAHRTMGTILLAQEDLAGAEKQFADVLISSPGDLASREQLAQVLWKEGKFRPAVEQYQQLLERQPTNVDAWLAVARRLISDPRPEARFGAEARQIAQHVCEATGNQNIFALNVLAAAEAETGDFDRAQATLRQALQTPQGQQPANAPVLRQSIEFYRAHKKLIIKGQ